MTNENVTGTAKKKETKKEKRARVFPEIQQRLGIVIREVLDEKGEIRWVLTGNTKPVKELLKKHGLYFHATPYTPDVARAGITDPHWETDRPRKFDALLDDLLDQEKVDKVVKAHEVEETRRVEAEKQLKTLVESSPGDIVLTFGKHNGKKLSEIPLDYVEWLSREANSSSLRTKAAEFLVVTRTVVPTVYYNSPPLSVPTPKSDPQAIALGVGRTPKADVKPYAFTKNLGFGKRAEAMADAPKVGEIIQHKKFGPLVVVSVAEPRYFSREMLEDFDMFEDEPGWQVSYTAIAVERTPEEQASHDAALAASERKKAAMTLLSTAWEKAERPVNPQVTGDYYRVKASRFGIYSRTSYRLPAEGLPIWRIQENGADGDDWRPNNYGGCIADCVPFSAALAAAIREVGELLK